MRYTLWKRALSAAGLLYLILDEEVIRQAHRDIFSLATKGIRAGVDIFQFRFSNISDRESLRIAKKLKVIISRGKKTFIVNNRVDIVYFSGADGLHLGSEDISVFEARKILSKEKIVGKTIHSVKEAEKSLREEIDYLSVGPLFKTKTKPSLPPLSKEKLRKIIREVKRPLFAIGGINSSNISYPLREGLKNLAICRGIILNTSPTKEAKKVKQCLRSLS